jgi:PKHD-type hydroxylase
MFSFSMQPGKYGRTYSEWDNVFTPAELDQIIAYGDSLPQGTGAVSGGDGQAAVAPQTRDSTIAWMDTNEGTRWIYERLQGTLLKANALQFGFALTGILALQYTSYRYIRGMKSQHYTWHIDDLGSAGPDVQERGECRKLSAVVQLSDPLDYDGGDLHILGTLQTTARKSRGLTSVFHSMTRHQVTPVTRGRRITLVAWAYGPEFI